MGRSRRRAGLSILPTVNLPAASESKGLGSGQADFTIALLTGTDFLTRGHIDVNYGIGRSARDRTSAIYAASRVVVGQRGDPRTGHPTWKASGFRGRTRTAGAVAAMDTGAIYVINPRLAFDGGVQVGLTEAAPTLSAFAESRS